jgi:hypothetical protein
MLARLGSKSPPVLHRLLAWAPQTRPVLQVRPLPAHARFGTTKSSAALTSFGVRGSLSGSPALPFPCARRRCCCSRTLVAGEVCLQLTRCAWLGGLPSPLSVLLVGTTATVGAPARRRRTGPQGQCRLTCRSTGRATAWHPGRDALVVHVAPHGQGATPSRAGYLDVRATLNKAATSAIQ